MQVLSLGWEDPLEEEMATHSSTLAWRIPWTEEPDGLQSVGSRRVADNLVTKHTRWYIETQLVLYTAVTTSNVAKFTSALIVCLFCFLQINYVIWEKKDNLFPPFWSLCLFNFSPNHCILARTSEMMMNIICDNYQPVPHSQS